MNDFISNSSFLCITLTVVAFCIGSACQSKWKLAILNPILIGAGIIMLTLTVLNIPVEEYQAKCQPLSYFMTPATICLAISFAEQVQRLKEHFLAVFVGVLAGTLCSMGSIAAMARVFSLDKVLTVSLLPKSVTTAIGVVLSEQAGGIGTITTVAIIITGILGNVAGPAITKVLHIEDDVAKGVAYGTASHVIGTARAVTVAPLTGAVSSLSLTLAGMLTTVLFSVIFN